MNTDKLNEAAEKYSNLAEYNMNDKIGSSHWFNTLIGKVRDIGVFMNKEPQLTTELQTNWGKSLSDISKDMIEWYEQFKAEQEEYKPKVEFYREQTEKLRKYIDDNKLGAPNEKFFDVLYNHIQELKKKAEQQPISGVKKIPEVAQLDAVINTYVHAHGSETYKHIQERFWIAIEAINKSALQYTKPVWVKASERLPGIDKICRKIGTVDILDSYDMCEAAKRGYYKSSYYSKQSEFKLSEWEWLYESALQYSASDGWIDVKDKPPLKEVINIFDGYLRGIGYRYGEKSYQWIVLYTESNNEGNPLEPSNITHWQPLPAAPQKH